MVQHGADPTNFRLGQAGAFTSATTRKLSRRKRRMTSKEKMKAGGTSSEDSRSKPAVEQMAPRQSPRKKPPARSEHSDISMLLYVAEEMMLREEQEAKKIAEQIVAERKAANDKGAAAPVKKKPVSTTRRQKISLKHLQAQEEIAIDVLQGLSDRMLRELFSIKSTSNDYTPHFSYICAFYADCSKCTQTFKGFRDETKVFEHLEAHIREHVNQEAKKEKKKKTMASAKKEKCSSPKNTKTDTATTMENQTSGQTNDKASKKRKVQDDKENQTCSITDKESETSAKKKIRRSESSESSESGVPVEVEVKEEICFVKMPHADHTYAAVAEHQRPATPPSPSSLSDRSFSSGSFEEPGSPSEDEEAKVILSGDPLATKEEIVSDTVDQELHEDSACKKEVKAKGLNVRRKKTEEIPEEIKKLALEYIEELQSKKKDENFQLVCKICNNGKVFTAAASLINHYRSHAGIKLFKCELCESSYTRKHSLNYHMLIHAGKFIIDCKYCGRWFRHRSHHKEHLRKHTGETPYECLECSPCIKYKTRNTYKRHLRTHHGKILSKFGTIMMSEEEFAKVRTKKYKKSASSDASHHRQKSPPSSAESSPNREEPPQLPSTSSTPVPSVPLPPVGTILSGLSPMTTQPSLGILPPMGAIQAAAAAPVAVLGVPNMVCHASVYPTYSSPLSAPITLMPQASFSMGQPGITVCQPSVTVSTDSQGQTFYTITGFAPMVPTESAAPVYTSHSVQGQTGGAREMDMADYKPVGYVTHN